MGLKGKRATGGFSGDLNRLISTENSPVNQILWDAGCGMYMCEQCTYICFLSTPTNHVLSSSVLL